MSTFVEVQSVEKDCQVIINLDHVVEIAPLKEGGCAIFLTNNESTRVKDSYELFKQFALQTVSVDDIAKKFKSVR